MQKINKRQGLMLCAAGLLVIVMLTVFVRLGTRQVLVKRAHMDNVITRTILYGNMELQKVDTKAPQEKIDWERAYPFADIDGGTKIADLPTKKIESKVAGAEKKIGDWTGKNLLGYYKLAEAGRGYNTGIGWGLSRAEKDSLLPLGDGAWTFSEPRAKSVWEKTESLTDLAKTAEGNGAAFLYIQAPVKTDPYGDFAVNGIVDFSNQNCDESLKKLQENGIETLDLRQDLHRWSQADHCSYHEYFFRTDHHWKPETALRAAKVVGDKLREYGIPVDDRHYDLQEFDVEVLPRFFLGSQGKKATLARTEPDDFSILHPKFPTEITLNIPEKNIHDTGDFELVYDKRKVEHCDYYGLNPYAMYGYGDMQVMDIENLLMPSTDKKVLIIKDSFCDTMAPMLSLGIRNLMTLDVRHFTGSAKTYIAVHKPDVVIVMYTGSLSGSIDWSSHKDQFDFR